MAIKVSVPVESAPLAEVKGGWQVLSVVLTGKAPVDAATGRVNMTDVRGIKLETRANGRTLASVALKNARAVAGSIAVAGGLSEDGAEARAIETALDGAARRAIDADWQRPTATAVSTAIAVAIEKAKTRAIEMAADADAVESRILSRM